MSINAILFDLDGTLVDSERESAEALARVVFRAFGITLAQSERDYVIGRSWGGIHAYLTGRHPRFNWTVEQMIAEASAERHRITDAHGLTVLPGAVAAVRRFGHLARAIVTGSSRGEAHHVVGALGLDDVFQTIVTSEDVSRSKPSPEGYLMAAHALGVAPGQCVIVEDSEPGILAGRAAGAHVIAVRAGNFSGNDQSRAHHIIDSLTELTGELLQNLAHAPVHAP